MDLSFARRNNGGFPGSGPQSASRSTLDIQALLAALAARQASTPTARLQTKTDKSDEIFSAFCPKAATFAPVRQERNRRNAASFSEAAAALITESQSS